MESKLIYQGNNDFIQNDKEIAYHFCVEAIRLRNFKAFEDSGWIAIRKIVILIGKNSIGKSSITQAFRMLRTCFDKFEQGLIQPGLVSLEGDFGSFSDIKNKNADDDSFCISFRLINSGKMYQYEVSVSNNDSGYDIKISLYDSKGKLYSVSDNKSIINIFFARLPEETNLENARLFLGAVDSIRRFAENLVYIEPVRISPRRIYPVSGSMAPSVGIRGENTYDMLFHLSQIEHEIPESIRVWLKEFGSELVWKSQEDTKNLGCFMLKNLKTGNLTNLVDNGFGISQSLPLVLEMTMKREGLLIIDSPEAHLQAPIEAKFADLLLMTLKAKTSVMLETGSEHIILRLRKLVAESKISARDLACYYIDEIDGDDKVKCHELSISDEGILEGEETSFSEFFSSAAKDLMEIKMMQFNKMERNK